jgi:hypothetical protein
LTVSPWMMRVLRAELRAKQAEQEYMRLCHITASALSMLSDEELLELRDELAREVDSDAG